MLENDADRLAMIRSLGGLLVSHPAGEFWGIFDGAYQRVQLSGLDIESIGPAIEARTMDVAALTKDTVLTLAAGQWRIKSQEPDGTGMTVLHLRQ